MNTMMLLAVAGNGEKIMGMSRALFGLVIFILGMLVVFMGICILIGCINLVKIFMGLADKKSKPIKNAAKTEKTVVNVAPQPVAVKQPTGVSPEVIAVITAAIAATYQEEQAKTEFVVKRNKKFR